MQYLNCNCSYSTSHEYVDCQIAIRQAMLDRADRLEKEATQLRAKAAQMRSEE